MTEIEQMIQRATIESMNGDFSKEEQNKSISDIDIYKSIMRTDDITKEIIAFIIFLHKVKQ